MSLSSLAMDVTPTCAYMGGALVGRSRDVLSAKPCRSGVQLGFPGGGWMSFHCPGARRDSRWASSRGKLRPKHHPKAKQALRQTQQRPQCPSAAVPDPTCLRALLRLRSATTASGTSGTPVAARTSA